MLNSIWSFYLKSLILAIVLGIFIGQYFAVQGYTGAGRLSSDFVSKIERFIKYKDSNETAI